ncbi:hypothetical protein [Zavarzinia sp. CC-PAN008]|uniref:hypothetical protein n=1 Tax=Zavarzinia sp. CC-PAN008 TaxID=3243332 RepID=UPI003F749030
MAQIDSVQAYETAAAQGDIEACVELGLSYATGRGVERDYVIAHKWLNVAATKGDAEARQLRAELAHDMTAADVREAQRLAREWLASTTLH